MNVLIIVLNIVLIIVLINVLTILQVIAAQGEQKASQALKMASEVISESSGALQLRYLQARDPLIDIFRASFLI